MKKKDIFEFIKFLKDHSAFDAFDSNIKSGRPTQGGCCSINHDESSVTAFLTNYTGCASRVIDESLTWKYTPENHTYWSELNQEWQRVYRGLKTKQKAYKSIW